MFNGRQSPGGINGSNPLIYQGSTPNMVTYNRRPTVQDGFSWPIGMWWIVPKQDTSPSEEVWTLVSKADGINTWKRLGGSSSGSFIKKTYLTTPGSGTFVFDTNMVQVYVECIGGGGSGSTQSTPLTGNFYGSAPGGAGAYCAKLYTAAQVGSSQSYNIGAGGIAVTMVTNSDGLPGGDTTFMGMTAGGGFPGENSLSNPTGSKTNNGGLGGLATGGDINKEGGAGQLEFYTIPGGTSTLIYHGYAGSSFYGEGPYCIASNIPSPAPIGTAGSNGSGGGGISLESVAATHIISGNGGDGLIIITEYLG